MTEEEFQTHVSHLSKNTVGELLYERSWEAVKDICKQVQPTYILELGFNRGSSALMWLFNTPNETKLHSIDKRNIGKVSESLKYIDGIFGKRFKYSHLDHAVLTETYTKGLGMVNKYDLIFIDGSHNHHDILRDAKNMLKLNSKYIAFDDYFHVSHGPDTKKVISELGLEIIQEYKNPTGQVLTKNPFYTR
tara:strand:+ start:132 stop:704 length:573 start_codon:yes stop_codon:yes gene_type:complete